MKTTLTPEQSATLIAKGISADKASEKKREYTSLGTPIGYMPIFTLTDLLSLVPKTIPDGVGKFSYVLKIQPNSLPGWQVCYYAYSLDKGKGYCRDEELVNALYELLLWAIDNGHIDLTK